MPRGRRSQLLTDPRLGTPTRAAATTTTASRNSPIASRSSPIASRSSPIASRSSPIASRSSPIASQRRFPTRQMARYDGPPRGRGRGSRASVANGTVTRMDTTLADGIEQLSTDLLHLRTISTRGGDVIDLKTKCRSIVEKLSALVPHDPDNIEDKTKARNTILTEALNCASETFNREFEEYGELVWRSPNLISSMRVLLVVYLSYMPLYEPDHAADTVICFAVDLFERFDSMQTTYQESQVLSLAAIYLRIYYAYNNTGVMINENIARPLFNILLKFTDNYIWQELPFEFLKDLPNLYKKVVLKCCYAQHLDELLDYLATLSTKEVIKALYADTIVFGQHRLLTYNDNRANKSVDLVYQKFDDWVSFGANNHCDLSNAKEIDRSLDILCQVILCNNEDFKILFPAYEIVEVYILPLLYDGIPTFLKLRACHFLAIWLHSFLYRYTYGPSKDAVLCGIIDILLNRFQIDRNISVRFAIARCLTSVYRNPSGRDIAMGATITSTSQHEPVVCELIETFACYPHEGSLALAANYLLERHPSSFKSIFERLIEILLNLLDRICKRLQFNHLYGRNSQEDEEREKADKDSTNHALTTLEVVLKAAAESKSLRKDYDFYNLEFRVVSILVFIYTNMIIDLKLYAVAFRLQIALGALVFTDVSRDALDGYAKLLKAHIGGMSGEPEIEDLAMNLSIWRIRVVKSNAKSSSSRI